MASEELEIQAEAEMGRAAVSASAPATMPSASADAAKGHRNDWRVLLVVFILAGIVESQAFGHLGAFTPLFLQELRVSARDIPTWTGVLSGLGFVIGLPLLPFWGVCKPLPSWVASLGGPDRHRRRVRIVSPCRQG